MANWKTKAAGALLAFGLVAGGGIAATAATSDCRVWSGGGWLEGACPTDTTPTVGFDRLGGASKYDTAAAISAAHHAPGVAVVYIANGNGIDAVAAGASADGPILTVPATGTLPASTDAELRRLNPGRVVVLGGPVAVSDSMAAQALAAAGK